MNIMLRHTHSLLFFIVTILACLAGCAYDQPTVNPVPPPRSTEDRRIQVAVVPARSAVEAQFLPYAKGRGSGAALGATEGAARGAASGASISFKTGPLAALTMPFFLGAGAVIGGTSGAIGGTVRAVPKAEADRVQAVIDEAVKKLDVQNRMAEYVLAATEDVPTHRFALMKRAPLSSENEDTKKSFPHGEYAQALEVRVARVGFDGGEHSDPSTTFFMDAEVRLLNRGDEYVRQITLSWRSPPRKASAWAKDDGRLLEEAFKNAYSSIAERAVTEVFLLMDLPVSLWSTQRSCLLDPIYPKYRFGGFFHPTLRFTPVDSVLPTLRWTPFPLKDRDLKEKTPQIEYATYDLRIWRAEDGVPTTVVYARNRLPRPYHTVEEALKPSTEYFWAVRARFSVQGRERVTRWAYSRRPGVPVDACASEPIPNPNYFRFVTPASR